MIFRFRLFLTATALLFLSGVPMHLPAAETGFPAALENLEYPVLILADAATGEIILQRNQTEIFSPASLAKLMTLHLILSDVESGKMRLDEVFPVTTGGDAASMRPSSSVLGLRTGDRITLITLLRAAAVASGGDASWSLAMIGAPDVESFVVRMNGEAAALGMTDTNYSDPDGWSSISSTTGGDQMKLALHYIQRHPEALEQIHSLENMRYLDSDRLTSYPAKRNTNMLLGRYPGVDGLKTGTIPLSEFHFIATAKRESIRLIALCMGLEAPDYFSGLNQRAAEAAALLDWGFDHYTTWTPEIPDFDRTRVLHGTEREVPVLAPQRPGPRTLNLERVANIEQRILRAESVTAPVNAGDVLGRVIWEIDGEIIQELPLLAGSDVDRHWRLKDFLEQLFSSGEPNN